MSDGDSNIAALRRGIAGRPARMARRMGELALRDRGGIELDREAAHVWTMREGKAARIDVFQDRHRALLSAGLEDPE